MHGLHHEWTGIASRSQIHEHFLVQDLPAVTVI
jgi:hypothetical protein